VLADLELGVELPVGVLAHFARVANDEAVSVILHNGENRINIRMDIKAHWAAALLVQCAQGFGEV